MKTRDKIALVALLVFTIITLLTSVEHHHLISERYGPIANVFVPLIVTSSFILGALISLVFQWGINVIQFEKIVKLLPANEAAVMKVLFNRRRMTQAELTSETGLSRLMVSRVLSNLEDKGVIAKKPLENTNFIESKLYRAHPTAQALTRMPGISEEKLVVVIAIVFLFGLSVSVLNSFHVLVVEHPLEPSLYLLAIEFFAIGGLTNIVLRKSISAIQFERILGMLPDDERETLRAIYLRKSITQRELVEATGIYKMKVSRVLDKFERSGIVEKKPYGYTNMIASKI